MKMRSAGAGITAAFCAVLLLAAACIAVAQPHVFGRGETPLPEKGMGFAGIGAVLHMATDEAGEEKIVIGSVIPAGPAAKAGIRDGDRILEVDGKPVKGLGLKEVVERIRGEAGAEVTLKLAREGADEPLEIVVVREQVGPLMGFPRGEQAGEMGGPMQMGPVQMGMPPAPVMLIEDGYLYILIGNVLYKVNAETLEQVNAVHQMPPPPPEGFPGFPMPPGEGGVPARPPAPPNP